MLIIKKIDLKKNFFRFVMLLVCFTVESVVFADKANIITFYMTNTGMHVTVGMSDEIKPELNFSLDQSTEPALVGYSPMLGFSDSPLKFFNHFWFKHGDEISHHLNQGEERATLPTKIYIAAAGVEEAEKAETPTRKEVEHFLSSYSSTDVNQCLQSANRKEFFRRIFLLEAKKWLPDISEIDMEIGSNVDLMTTAASVYLDREKSTSAQDNEQQAKPKEKPTLLIGHMSNTVEFYTKTGFPDASCLPIKTTGFTLQGGGSYDMGALFCSRHLKPCFRHKTMKPVIERFEQQKALQEQRSTYEIEIDQPEFERCLKEYCKARYDSLLPAVYSLNTLHQSEYIEPGSIQYRYKGAPYMFCRLHGLSKGHDLFGEAVKSVLCHVQNPAMAHKFTQHVQYSAECAYSLANILAIESIQSLLDLIVVNGLHSLWQFENGKKMSKLILVGEKIDLLEVYAQQRNTTVSEALLQKLNSDSYVMGVAKRLSAVNMLDISGNSDSFSKGGYSLRSNPKMRIQAQQKQIVNNLILNARALVKNMAWVSSEEFPDLMHQAALQHLSE